MQRTVNEIIEDLKQLQTPSPIEAKIKAKIAEIKAEFMENIAEHEVFDLGADNIDSYDHAADLDNSIGDFLFKTMKENDRYDENFTYFSDVEEVVRQINEVEGYFFQARREINLLKELLDTDTK